MNWSYKKYSGDENMQRELLAHDLKPTLALTNDGQAFVMDENGNRVCLVDMQCEAKRSERWRTECPQRDLNARLIASAPKMMKLLDNVATIDYAEAQAILNYINGVE